MAVAILRFEPITVRHGFGRAVPFEQVGVLNPLHGQARIGAVDEYARHTRHQGTHHYLVCGRVPAENLKGIVMTRLEQSLQGFV